VTATRAPRYLRTEYHVDPLGLDETEPRFSWLLDDDRRGARQSAYQLLVSSSADRLTVGDGDLWDSGKVESDATAHVVYAGAPLLAFASAVWKVRSWDGDDAAGDWSEPASFELGPLSPQDWAAVTGSRGAAFIRASVVGDSKTSPPAPYLRREFDIPGTVVRARLYVTALGLYEASINGRIVTDDVHRPGWTDYSRRVPFQAYDVTELLQSGSNALGVILGDGWYCGFIGGRRQVYGDRPQALALLRIELEGESAPLIVGTDDSWRTTTGPILSSDNYDGETYDARLELPGWDRPGYDDADWAAVESLGSWTGGNMTVVATTAPPVRRIEELRPRSVTARPGGATQFDFGQNMVGRVRIRVQAPAGTEIVLRFAEILEPDGSLHTANLATAKATDRYIAKGDGVEVYEPRFTFHGFRYLEVTGVEGLDADAVSGLVLHSDAPFAGDFECSSDLLTQLQRNIRWGQRGNWVDVPTDCPQRSERLGWTGDIQVFSRTATFNMDVASFLSKYVTDLRDGQLQGGIERGSYPWVAPSVVPRGGGPGWADAGVVVPWVVYERYGDLRVLERHYASMLGYVEFLERTARGRTEGRFLGFGDWLALDAVEQDVEGFGVDDRFGGTPRDLLWLAYDAYSTGLVARIAGLLGRAEDAGRLTERRATLDAEFARRYVGADGRLSVTTQTACLLALHFDLLRDPAHRQSAVETLVENIERVGHLETGFLGTPYLLPVLGAIGRPDLAYRLLERTEYPSWLYPVTQGATTIWERWDAWTATDGFKADGMNSFNHYAYGAVGEWLFRAVAGIDTTTDGAGYRELLVSPELGGSLTSARAHLETLHGRVETSWTLDGERATLNVTVPANTTAILRLPVSTVEQATEGGRRLTEVAGLSAFTVAGNRVECRAVAGRYEFVLEGPR
jgi:alpha-L-rhamnosidase